MSDNTIKERRLGCGFRGSLLSRGIPFRSYTKGRSRRATMQGSQSYFKCAAREHFGLITVSRVRK